MVLDEELLDRFGPFVLGFDEVGRGCIAGPLTVGVVAVNKDVLADVSLAQDSKKVTPARRRVLSEQFVSRVPFGVGSVPAQVIDQVGMSQALRIASAHAWSALRQDYDLSSVGCVLVDGPYDWVDSTLQAPRVCQVRGDSHSSAIAAASIIAKVHRDAVMEAAAVSHPRYGWERNKGYGTKEHYEAIAAHGTCEQHRHSFRLYR